MENPRRDLPRVINAAMSIVLLGFVLMNIALYAVVPIQVLRQEPAVAVVRWIFSCALMTKFFFEHNSLKLSVVEQQGS